MPGPRPVFLSAEGIPPTVFASQVAGLLEVLARELGLRFDFVGLDPLYPWSRLSTEGRRRRGELAASLPGALHHLPLLPYEDRAGLPFARRLLRRALGPEPLAVHARGLWAADLAARLGLPFVYDVRGDALAERALHLRGRGDAGGLRVRLGARRLLAAERRAVRHAAAVLCVSDALRRTLAARHGACAGEAFVVPCCHDPARFLPDPALRAAWRRRLGLEDAFVLAYAGGLGGYHEPEAVARAALVARRLRPDAHLLWVCPDPARARALAHRAGLRAGEVTCLRLPHADVPGALNAADLALLLRRRDPVHAAASPTKAAEALACGVPLLVSEGIGDLSGLVRREGLGAVLGGPPDDTAALEAALGSFFESPPARDRVAQIARERLARDRYLPVYRRVYARLGLLPSAGEEA